MDTVKHISEHLDSQRRQPRPRTKISDSILSDESSDYNESNSEDYLAAGELDNSETVVDDQLAKNCIKRCQDRSNGSTLIDLKTRRSF